MCWHRLNRLVHLSHELRKPIGGDEHVVDLRVVNPLDRSGLDALQDSTSRFRLRFNISNLEGLNQSQGARYGIRRAAPGAEVGRGFRPTPQPWAKAGLLRGRRPVAAVNDLIGRLLDEALPTVRLAHRDLAVSPLLACVLISRAC
jgi:hypothetical protein